MSSTQNQVQENLDKIGREIDDLRQSVRQTVVEKAIEIGKRLLEAKALCPADKWLDWLADREMSERSSQNYMKMARVVQSDPKQISDLVKLSYREALKALQEPAEQGPRSRSKSQASSSERAEQPDNIVSMKMGKQSVKMSDFGPDVQEQIKQKLNLVPGEPEEAGPVIDGHAVATPDLLTAVEGLARFLPEDVTSWLDAHPDEVSKVRDHLKALAGVVKTIQGYGQSKSPEKKKKQEEPAELVEKIKTVLAANGTSKTDLITRAQKHASKGTHVTEDGLDEMLAGRAVNYHVRNALQSALAELS